MPGWGTYFPGKPLCGCVGRALRGANAATWLLDSTCPVSSHFTPFPCATGALPAPATVVTPGVDGLMHVLRPCWTFKQRKSGSYFCHPNPHRFLQPKVMVIYLPNDGTLGCVVWPGAGLIHSQGILPIHSASATTTYPPIFMILPLLPIWMNVVSLNPWLSDFHTP